MNHKTVFLTLLYLLLSLSARSQTIVLKNNTTLQRHEVVEVENLKVDSQLVLFDAFDVEQPYQWTHDGKLLLFASIRPYGTATYKLKPGKPSTAKPFVFVKHYPERLDDIMIENDRTAYRFYGPALQRSGQQGYGIDIWLKSTPDMIVDNIYKLEYSRHPEISALKKQGKQREAELITTLTSYHLNHGMGMDCYNVGPTLGCGTPSIIVGDSLLFPWCYDTYKVLDQGPLRVSVQMDFAPTDRGSLGTVTEHRIVTLDRGSNFCQMKVWYTGLKKPANVASGFVIHAADTTSLVVERDFMHYADPTSDPERYNCQIYVATLYPAGISTTKKMMYQQPANGNAGHAVGIHQNLHNDEPFTYYFGSAWSQYDVHSQAEWQLRITSFMQACQQPLDVSVYGNPVLPDFHADPEVLYSKNTGRFYIYPTTDGYAGWGGYSFDVFSSDDLVHFRNEGTILNLSAGGDAPWASGNAWAPCIEEKQVGGKWKYFFFFSAHNPELNKKTLGVAVADSPTGPFKASEKPLFTTTSGGQMIDSDVFTDPKSGQTYLYYGNGHLHYRLLSDDMMSIGEEEFTITPKGGSLADYAFREGVYVFYRKGLYYFLWSVDDTGAKNYHVAYGTSKSPQGPIKVAEKPIVIIQKPEEEIYGTGHNSIVNIPGTDEWYIVYHRINKNYLNNGPGFHREVCIDKLTFAKDGTINQVQPTHKGIKPVVLKGKRERDR